MTPHEFVEKWRRANLSERSAYQQHFLDLCELLGQPKPAAADPDGAWYTFEKGVTKTEGGKGWADVWMRGFFGWEYKGKHKDLNAAYKQLLLYREDLQNPPLLVVCDLDRFEIHTNFTGTVKTVHAFDLEGLAEQKNLDLLRKLFTDPEALRPGQTTVGITEDAARRFGKITDGLRARGVPAPDAAHFIMKLVFCMFGEDIGLLPEKVFSTILAGAKHDPKRLGTRLKSLFAAMATGGDFGPMEIPWFNGGLFSDDEVFDLTREEIEELIAVAEHDWASVEPSIFGTLFERTLDPAKRSQIGAHYTSREDIETLLEPVVMVPLRREWDAVRAKCDTLWEKIKAGTKGKRTKSESKPRKDHDRALQGFVERLAHVSVLDPACGSGNFLYVAIHLLLDLEKEVIAYAARHGTALLPQVRPTQLSGIEINPYAQQLAQVVIWIGYLQWMHHNGFNAPRNPILEPIESIRRMDAILDLSDPKHPKEPVWPDADFIVGNPPFLGNKQMRSELGDQYVEALWALYDGRLPATSDLCCYWFEKSHQMVLAEQVRRGALLATTALKQHGNRRVLERVNESGRIFWAISDRDWVLDGASVRICMVGFEKANGSGPATLDGVEVPRINPDLTGGLDLTIAKILSGNQGSCFMGTTKVGAFDLRLEEAWEMLHSPNPSGRPNSDVLRPWRNGSDIVRNPSNRWIIDFGTAMPMNEASQYEVPFEYLVKNVKPDREGNKRRTYRERWWIHAEARPGFRKAVVGKRRYIATARVAKHRLFVWLDSVVIPDSKIIAIAKCDDVSLGTLHSLIHEKWTLAKCGWHGIGNDATYNPTTCFETFPFPEPNDAQRQEIAQAAAELDRLRTNWLNPPEWTREEILEFPGSVDGPWARYVQDADARGIGTVRYPRRVPCDDEAARRLAKRTLTNLYNERPTWLDLAHRRLDEAVFAAYGWPADLSDEDLLARLLALNLERA